MNIKKHSLFSAIAATFVGMAALLSMPAQASTILACTVNSSKTTCSTTEKIVTPGRWISVTVSPQNGYSQVNYAVYRGDKVVWSGGTDRLATQTITNDGFFKRSYYGKLSNFQGLVNTSAKLSIEYR